MYCRKTEEAQKVCEKQHEREERSTAADMCGKLAMAAAEAEQASGDTCAMLSYTTAQPQLSGLAGQAVSCSSAQLGSLRLRFSCAAGRWRH